MSDPLRIFVIGGSAGGRTAIIKVLEFIPTNFEGAILVVLHGSLEAPSIFPKILSKKLGRVVLEAENGAPISKGGIYIAKPDYHLFVHDGRTYLSQGPRENLFRPSIDVLFRSAAVAYGNRCVGILLTGFLQDGTAGLEAIKKCGGLAIIEDPTTAEFGDMPAYAMEHVAIDHVVGIGEMGGLIEDMMDREPPKKIELPASVVRENSIATKIGSEISLEEDLGHQVPISCASCGGPLWKIEDSKIDRYRCHLGHAFSEEALLRGQNDTLEEVLWTALRTLEEKKRLLQRVHGARIQSNDTPWIKTQANKIDEIETQIKKMREILRIPE